MLYLGCHVSMKAPKYLEGSIQEALQYGANACMVYTGPPSNSKRVDVEKLNIVQAKRLMEENHFKSENVIIHAPYIINIANTLKPETYEFGVSFLKNELKRVEAIGSTILVLHPGSHVNAGIEAGLDSIVNGLNEVLKDDDTSVRIALETMAGKGSELGSSFEQLQYIISHVEKNDRLGVCLDTCHIHDAGYDVSDFDTVLNEFDAIIGLDRLLVVHVNDSKNERGAHKDRHENIGKGHIGFDSLYKIVHHEKLDGKCMILETPYIDGKAPYKEEIQKLKEID
ncbi:deoxyribonuclease IV [Floccifex sp.]|uniref:deoxyribonuclease IV n=1 Tax=Floccifex sp. TaxID=2815810 RepID=UPI002A74E460|nr:deoxyribonuclease IV [Floccifex sp.]MDD7281388.1 deoxyribonuclease IV [Erysipelotrichaceae bacterium]MDY2958093.1 deoxyribonuclease IV [Floccifex sp.]